MKPTSAECDTAVGTTNRLAVGREGADAKRRWLTDFWQRSAVAAGEPGISRDQLPDIARADLKLKVSEFLMLWVGSTIGVPLLFLAFSRELSASIRSLPEADSRTRACTVTNQFSPAGRA